MVKIMRNKNDWWAVAVKIYNDTYLDQEVILWRTSDGMDKLEKALIEVLEQNGYEYKNKHRKDLQRVLTK